ncbi:spore maturation protein [Konateibacter massiliensis]|uniref:spore maturation protein n=1 Tax=Konateibacter massiliensis TaxID=2002841 RepID=UPI000C144C45|nr:nucleoside recognition domain-containing protein [Konateibacter massiliensis]
MKVLIFLSNYIMPLMIFYIVGFGLLMKKNIYDEFISGAKDGFKTVLNIMPTLIGLMMGVGILRASGFLNFLAGLVGGLTSYLQFPSELVPLAIVRLFSSSAATGLALDLFKEYGTDSYIGLTASIMMGCTETVFYTMSVYFMAAKVTKTRWTLAGALLSTITGVILSAILARMM